MPQTRYLSILERLLAIQATSIGPALDDASTLIAEAIEADKVDTFLHEPAHQTLVAVGTSMTPLGEKQRALGLDRLAIANRGRTVEVFETGRVYQSGHVDADAGELSGVRDGLGIRSSIIVPLDITGERRGVVQASSTRAEAFVAGDRAFLETVARWVGLVIQRAELIERVTRAAGEQARRLAAEELVTVLAHDMRNHLSPILSRVYLLRLHAERDGRRRDVDDADALARGLARLQRLISNLLDVARIEQGLFSLVRQPTDLVALAREAVAGVATPQFRITLEAPDDEVIAEVDPERIRQALENLLLNAQRHAPESPVTVRVAREPGRGERLAVVCVQDRGPGIAPELLDRLMQRFVRGSRGGGLGIGLYLARRIAEAHGGRLDAASAVGQGATFRLRLPLAPAPA